MLKKEELQKVVIEYKNQINTIVKNNPRYKVFFLTIVFKDPFKDKSPNAYISGRRIDTIWKNYNEFVRHLNSRLMNNFTKKLYLNTITFDFIDFPGTRHSKTFNLPEPETPHIHSIYLVHPDTVEKFKALVDDNFREITDHKSQNNITSIKALPVTENLPKVVSYCSKFLADPRAFKINSEAPLINQYPVSKRELKKRFDSKEKFYLNRP